MPEQKAAATGSKALRKLIKVFWIMAAVESTGAVFYLASIPGDTKNALIFGYSAQRLLLMGIIAFALALSLAAIFLKEEVSTKLLTSPLASQRKLFALFLLLSTLFWQLSFLPTYQLGRMLAYYQRLQPLLIWLTILLIQTTLLFIAGRMIRDDEENSKWYSTISITPFALILGSFLIFWLVVLVSGAGIGPGNNYWNKVGVPILGVQIIAAEMLGLFFLFLEQRKRISNWVEKKPWIVDLAVFFLIWGVTALCVVSTPIAPSRFNTLPAPPNYASYPFSDAGEYDLMAQTMLQGKNITYNYVDKPFHLVFLMVVHVLGGQDFNAVILVQVILLSVMPALLYLLGKALSNRTAGFIAAGLGVFYQINSIQATNLIQVSNSKMMMSEPLTAIGVIVLCLLAVKWLKSPRNWWWKLSLVSGVVGLVSMIRLNAAPLMIVVLLAAAVQLRWNWKRLAGAVLIATVFFTLAFSPWVVRNAVVEDNPIQFLKNKVQGVIWNKRLSPIIRVSAEPSPTTPVSPSDAEQIQPIEEDNDHGTEAVIWPVVSNYAHNLVSTLLMVPPLIEQGDLVNTVRAPYWDNEWEGRFTQGGVILLIINLAVASLGAGGAWRRYKMAGLFPLLVLPVYNLSNAAALVSGGRYIVPVDWVFYFYFALGLAEISFFVLKKFNIFSLAPKTSPEFSPPYFRFQTAVVLPVAAFLLVVGSLPWMAESAFPENYSGRPAADVLQSFNSTVDWGASGITESDVASFLSSPGATLLEGQAFYPRFFQPGDGDTGTSASPFGVKLFPHFSFVLLGQERSDVSIYLESSPEVFPNGSDVIVLGCNKNEVMEAYAVISLPSGQTYVRPDLPGLKCPLLGPGQTE